jgi:hypothetical protein
MRELKRFREEETKLEVLTKKLKDLEAKRDDLDFQIEQVKREIANESKS